MPVFMAFGWAGEETALKYALDQLEIFVEVLRASLPQTMQDELPFHGMNEESQSAYMAATERIDDDVRILFNARPASLEIQVALTDKVALTKCLKQITKNPVNFHKLLSRLEPEWTLRVQQMEINEETGEQGNYQEVFKDSHNALDEAKTIEVFEKAAYLNSDDKWVTPIYLSQRISAEQASTMKREIIPVLSERLSLLAPVITMLRGRSARRAVKSVAAKKAAKSPAKKKTVKKSPAKVEAPTSEEFTYISELKPLHIRRGFINMTTQHWPFFAINARTESRPVILIAESMRDEDSAVWRLQPDNVARLVLSPSAQRWLEDSFVAGDSVHLTVTKNSPTEIQIVLDIAE